ncbi:MAG: hypothetical protein ACM3NQ_05150 [Bacteroidales bacterium]
MKQAGLLKIALKRGALLAAANWPVVLIQFTAESIFKVLVAVPVLSGVFMVTLLLGRDLRELLNGDLRDIVTTVASALVSQPAALAAFVFAFGLVLVGGSALMFLVKGGTVWVLADADRSVGPIERSPLRLTALQAASRYSIDNFMSGAARVSRRYLTLGLLLIIVYLLSAAGYLVAVFGGYRWITNRTLLVAWTLVAAFLSTLLVAWITLVNLLYLLTQIVITVSGRGVRWSLREVLRFLRAELWDVMAVFGVVLVLVVLATAASIGATAGLGLVAFIPVATLVLLPLQLVAWLLRNLVFQYLGLTALTAYLHLYAPPANEARERWPRSVSASH